MFTDLAEVVAELGNVGVSQPTLAEKIVMRRNRPFWANSDHDLVKHCFTFRFMRPLLVAFMYWRLNMRQKAIAARLGMTEDAVKFVLRRLRLRK